MKQHSPKIIKIRGNEIVDWSKLVGKRISTDRCSKPQVVYKNGPLEKKLLAFSRLPFGFREYGCFIAHCTGREHKQFYTSHDPYNIYPEDASRALKKLYQEIGWEWGNVTTLELIHTHQKSQDAYNPLSQDDIEVADRLAIQLCPQGVKNIIMTAASETGYSFKYSPPGSTPNPEVLPTPNQGEELWGKKVKDSKILKRRKQNER